MLTACAVKCLGGGSQVQLADNDGLPRPGRVYGVNDLVRSGCVFAATGITDGSLLRGVRYWPDGATTSSMVMRARSGTVRYVEAEHSFAKLEVFAGVSYRR